MRNSAGAILGITCCVTDITPIKRVAAERERLIQELAQTHLDLVRRNPELEALDHEKSRWQEWPNTPVTLSAPSWPIAN